MSKVNGERLLGHDNPKEAAVTRIVGGGRPLRISFVTEASWSHATQVRRLHHLTALDLSLRQSSASVLSC
jgi:hypothetical protein